MAAKKSPKSKSPIRVGNSVFVQSVTLYYTGKIVEITKDELVLEDAAWIAYTGRISECLSNGIPSGAEVEPFPKPLAIGRGAVVAVTDWPHALPRKAV